MMHKKRSMLIQHILGIIMIAAIGVLLLNYGYRRYLHSAYPIHYAETVEKVSQELGVSPSLIYAVISTESNFKADALSQADAKGLMQLTDSTFEWALKRAKKVGEYTPEDLFDPEINIYYGTYVITLLQKRFSDEETVLAAYNAGQGRVKQWLLDARYSSDGIHLSTIPYRETADYVKYVKRAQKHYQHLYQIP